VAVFLVLDSLRSRNDEQSLKMRLIDFLCYLIGEKCQAKILKIKNVFSYSYGKIDTTPQPGSDPRVASALEGLKGRFWRDECIIKKYYNYLILIDV
jgi:hypothetical protein